MSGRTTDIAALAAAMARARGRRRCRAAAADADGAGRSWDGASPGPDGDRDRRKTPLGADGTAATPPPPNPPGGTDGAPAASDASDRSRRTRPGRDAVAAGRGVAGVPTADGCGGAIVAADAAVAARRRDADRARKLAAASSSSPPERSSRPALPPGGIGAVAAEAARRRDAKADFGAPAAEALPEKARKPETSAPVRALAAEAARKKEPKPQPRPPALPPGGIAAAAAEAARKKEVKPQPRPPAFLPGEIAAAAAEAAARKKKLEQQPRPPALPHGGIAAAVAEAARKKELKPQPRPHALPPGGIAAAVAEAARKKELKPQPRPSALPPGGIAAAAAAEAARKKKREQQQPRPPALPHEGIAAAVAEAARKKQLKKQSTTPALSQYIVVAAANEKSAPPALPFGGISHAAAEAARKKELKQQSSPPALPPVGIAAAAAAAARKEEQKQQSASRPKQQSSRGIAALAAEAARKQELTRQSVSPALPPGGIAAAAAAEAARKKERRQQCAPPSLPPGGIAAVAAEAARKKKPKRQSLPPALPNGGTAAAAAEFTRVEEVMHQSRPPALPPGGIALAEAARKEELRSQSTPPAFPPAEAAKKNESKKKPRPQALPPVGIAAAAAEAARMREQQAKNTLPDSCMACASPDNPADFGFDPEAQAKKSQQQHQQKQKQQQQRQQDKTRRRLDFDTPQQSTPGTIDADVDDYDADEAADEVGLTPMNFDSQLSSLSSRSSGEPPTHSDSQADIDAIHAKAAEALIRVIEMKQLDFDHVLEKLEIYKRKTLRSNRHRTSMSLHTPIDIDDYNPDDGGSVSSQQSNMSTLSANHRKIASNSQKLATHIMHTPDGRFATLRNNKGSTTIPLKNDPEYSLYFRMLRYGFTIGAVRAAAIRDGKVDMTRLDPDLPVGRQRVPRVGVSEVDDSVASGGSSRDETEHSPGAAGFEDQTTEALTIEGLQFDSKGLTDEGWKNALNDAAARHRGSAGNFQTPSPMSSSQGRASPLGIPLTPGGGLLRKTSVDSAQSGSHTSVPPWLQSGVERGMVEGWLRKKTRRGRWVRRWYLLDSTGIYYSHSPPKSAYASGGTRKFTKLIDARTLGARRAHSNKVEFEIMDPSSQNRAVATLRAASEHEREQWVESIKTACERQRLVDEVVVGSAMGLSEFKETVDKFERVALDTQLAADQERRVENAWKPESGRSRRKSHKSGEGGVEVSISNAELRAFKRTSTGGSTGVAATPDDFNAQQSMSEGAASSAGIAGAEGSETSSELLSGPPNPLFDAGRPKRPKLQRQNSWPPVMLMSDGRLDKPGREGRFVDADLSHGMNLFAPGGGVWSGNGASGEGGGGSGTGDGSGGRGGGGGSGIISAKDKKDDTKDGGEVKLKHDPKYEKYFKMMKMGLPKEAAQHAMTRDQLDPSILDLDPEKSLKNQTKKKKDEGDGPPLKDDPKYMKYFKMIKMGLPKEAAQHAMTRDQLDPSILDLDPEKSLKNQQTEKKEDEGDGPPLKDDPKFSKYIKMMKMGLPKEAAKHAMVRDQLDPCILDMDPEKSLKSQAKGDDDGPPLKDDPTYAKYFKMLKMGLPIGAAKNAMTRDGLNPDVLDLDHNKSVISLPDAKGNSVLKGFTLKKKPKLRRKKVYWNKLDAKEGTVWSNLQQADVKLEHDVDEFEELFTQAIDAEKERTKKAKGRNESKAGTVKVIDSKRGMNGDIILRKVKLEPSDVVNMVERMDCGKLDPVELKSLYEFMPTDEEMKGLTSYLVAQKKKKEEAVKDLTPCEQYMVAMKDLKDSEKKFQCIIFLADFKGKMNELKWEVDQLSAACDELRSSKKFKTLLSMILKLVNKINIGDEGGPLVDGFTLDSLTKLSETKAFDNKTTVLHYLVRTILRNNKDILTFAEEIKSVVLAKGVVMERMLTSARKLCEDSRVVTETAARDGDEYRKSLKDPSQKWKFQDAKAQRASVKELRQMVTFLTEKEVPIGKSDTTHFERFALFSKLELQKALAVVKESNQGYIELLEYFGEDKKTQAGDFFGVLDNFLAEFDRAVDVVAKEEEEKLKEARRKLTKQAKEMVKSAYKSASCVDARLVGDGDANRKTWRENPIQKPTSREKKGDTPEKATSAANYTQKESSASSPPESVAAKLQRTKAEQEKGHAGAKAGVARISKNSLMPAEDSVNEELSNLLSKKQTSKTLTRKPQLRILKPSNGNNFKAPTTKSSTGGSMLAPTKTKPSMAVTKASQSNIPAQLYCDSG